MSGTDATTPTTYRNALPVSLQLQEYRIERVLGAGGFGITYLAHDTLLDKRVALKEYLPGDLALRAMDGSVVPVNTDREHDYRWGLDRFLQEARTLARFTHPNIVRVARYFEAHATGYMVMDFEAGPSLSDWLRATPRPDEARLKALLFPLLDGLEAVHAAGFLHRDIKPANIVIRDNGVPVLLDFGAARLATGNQTKTLTSVLTPGYAPLEQYTSDGNQGPWSDCYALAGVLYRAITSQNPADAVSRMKQDPVPSNLAAARDRYSAPFLKAVAAALVLEETRRPQTVAQWRALFLPGAAMSATERTLPPTVRASTALDSGVPGAALTGVPVLPATRASGGAVPASAGPPDTAARRTRNAAPPPRRWWAIVAAVIAVAWGFAVLSKWLAHEPALPPAITQTQTQTPVPATAPEPTVAPREELTTEPPRADRERTERPAERPARPAIAGDGGEPPARVLAEFRGADANADGYLSADEVRGRFPVIERKFSEVDADADSRISLREFAGLRQQQLEQKGGFAKPVR